MSTFILTRDVTREECWWLAETVTEGSLVYRCCKPTYGAVKDFPATFDPEGDYPFFELPFDAIEAAPTCRSCQRPIVHDETNEGGRCEDCANDLRREVGA